ncbi:MAG: hypothetical protein KUG83_09440 [Gammaproteobacteria bacterium]|nr:hypothetical protein [Gammaproteobacteria bacterium]
MHSTTYLINGINNVGLTLVLSHGLNSSVNSPFLEKVTDGLSAHGFKVIRFEFPFMVEGRLNNEPVYVESTQSLESYWEKVVKELGNPEKLVIGGKSIAAFAATRVADRLGVRGVLGMGFPFVSPDPDLVLHFEHLKSMQTPTMIIQGCDDPLGPSSQVDDSVFSHTTTLHWLENSGHNFIPSPGSKRSHDENILDTMEWIAEFLDFLEQ